MGQLSHGLSQVLAQGHPALLADTCQRPQTWSLQTVPFQLDPCALNLWLLGQSVKASRVALLYPEPSGASGLLWVSRCTLRLLAPLRAGSAAASQLRLWQEPPAPDQLKSWHWGGRPKAPQCCKWWRMSQKCPSLTICCSSSEALWGQEVLKTLDPCTDHPPDLLWSGVLWSQVLAEPGWGREAPVRAKGSWYLKTATFGALKSPPKGH